MNASEKRSRCQCAARADRIGEKQQKPQAFLSTPTAGYLLTIYWLSFSALLSNIDIAKPKAREWNPNNMTRLKRNEECLMPKFTGPMTGRSEVPMNIERLLLYIFLLFCLAFLNFDFLNVEYNECLPNLPPSVPWTVAQSFFVCIVSFHIVYFIDTGFGVSRSHVPSQFHLFLLFALLISRFQHSLLI